MKKYDEKHWFQTILGIIKRLLNVVSARTSGIERNCPDGGWKADGAAVKNAAAEGRTLSVYAIWALP